MKFIKGDQVEILSRENETDDKSWFPGQVIFVLDGTHLLVSYDLLMNSYGEPLTETISKNEVRPRPPVRKGTKWKVGDVAEVFHDLCWRAGRIIKKLKNNNFAIKLSGFVRLKEFHESDLRVQLVWSKKKWLLKGKDSQSRSKGTSGLVSRATFQPIGSRLPGSVKVAVSLKMMNNHLERPLGQNNTDKEEKASRQWLDASGFDSGRLQSEEDSYQQCSIASCSSNDFPFSNDHDFHQSLNVITENSDAESSFPSLAAKKQEVHTPICRQKMGEVDIHALEFHAYRSTVEALYAAGPLSWEQELLLTNLRESLHISDEEHLHQLRRLLSTEVL